MTPRCLVIVRAGDQSLHPQWTSDPSSRNWDLIVSYFGNDPARFRGAGENRIDDKGQKYHGSAAIERDGTFAPKGRVWVTTTSSMVLERSTIPMTESTRA